MCTYGIGLPFDHPIWQNLPPCRCGGGAITWPVTLPALTTPHPLIGHTFPEPEVSDGPLWRPVTVGKRRRGMAGRRRVTR